MKVFVQLAGGLGNQMFQYAAGRGVASKLGIDLVIDDWIGFIRDQEYKRDFELELFPIKARKAKAWERWPAWMWRADQKWKKKTKKVCSVNCQKNERWYGTFVVDDNRAFKPNLFDLRTSNFWMMGCFQSPKYFEFIASELRKELIPPLPTETRIRALGERLKNQPTLAIGIRLYEESKDPAAHALGRREKSMDEVRQALEGLRQKHPKLKIALFCTHRARLLETLKLPHDTAYITHEEGFRDSISRLWLLAQCRHHLFNNSSFYWWGAWLSAIHHGGVKNKSQEILAADNFFNKDSIPENWKRF